MMIHILILAWDKSKKKKKKKIKKKEKEMRIPRYAEFKKMLPENKNCK